MEVLPPELLIGLATVNRLVELVKTSIKSTGIVEKIPAQVWKFLLMVISIIIGAGVFLVEQSVASSFEWFLPEAPAVFRALFGGIVLAFGADFARLIFTLRDALKNAYPAPSGDSDSSTAQTASKSFAIQSPEMKRAGGNG